VWSGNKVIAGNVAAITAAADPSFAAGVHQRVRSNVSIPFNVKGIRALAHVSYSQFGGAQLLRLNNDSAIRLVAVILK